MGMLAFLHIFLNMKIPAVLQIDAHSSFKSKFGALFHNEILLSCKLYLTSYQFLTIIKSKYCPLKCESQHGKGSFPSNAFIDTSY